MKRRKAVKNMLFFTLGAGVLYSCTDPYQAVKDLGLSNFKFTNDQLSTIDQVSKIILPIQNIEALKDHTTLPFVMNMVHDIYNGKKRKIFQEGYSLFSDFYNNKSDKSWNKSTIEEQTSFVETIILEKPTKLDKINSDNQKVKYFLDVLKSENLQYLRTSEHIMRKARFYEMAPGRYDGSYPVSKLLGTTN